MKLFSPVLHCIIELSCCAVNPSQQTTTTTTNIVFAGERVFPCNQYEGITDDEIYSQVTDDSLQNSVALGTLDLTADTPDSSGTHTNFPLSFGLLQTVV